MFIQGEDFSYGAGHPYDPSILVSQAHVIVITLNFRLGILGKLYQLSSMVESSGKSIFPLINTYLFPQDF